MMDGLIQVVLIKSAKYEYAEVYLDGNSLLIGANGSGKTTLLRAILYFYTANTKTLGINPHKKISFNEYYFPYENSYIVYLYKKEQKYIAVIAYKESAPKFRFCLFDQKPDIKTLCIENNKPLESAKLWLKLKEQALLSPVINGGSEYRRVLYAKTNHKLSAFTLFYAKEYESFTKTLSNIFTNSRVDADAIKQVITASLEVERSIDLEQIKRHLDDFNRVYEDILFFEKSKKKIQNLIELLDKRELLLSNIQETLSLLAFNKPLKEKELFSAKEELDRKNKELQTLHESIKKEEQKFTKQKEHLSETIGAIKAEIKKAKEKEQYYQKIQIETKIKQYETLDSLLAKEKELQAKKTFLTKEHSSLEQEHQNQLQAIENSFQKQHNQLDQKTLTIQTNHTQKLQQIHQKESDQIEQIKEDYTNQLAQLKEQEHTALLHKQELQNRLTTIQKEPFIFSKQHTLQDTIKELKDTQNTIANLNTQLNYNIEALQRVEKELEQKQKDTKELFSAKEAPLKKELEKYHNLLNASNNSVASKVLSLPNKERYFYFLKEEILLGHFDLSIKEDSKQIFALEFQQLDIPADPISLEIEKTQKELASLKQECEIQIQNINRWFKNETNKLLRKQKELREDIKQSQIKQSTLESKQIHLQDLQEKEEKEFREQKGYKITSLQKQINSISTQLQSINTQLKTLTKEQKNKISATKASFTKEKNALEAALQKELSSIKIQKEQLNEQKQNALKQQEQNYHKLLEKNGIDTEVIRALQEELKTLQEQIKATQSLQELVFGYYKDKKEYLELLPQKRTALKQLQKELEEKTNTFNTHLEHLHKQQDSIQEQITKIHLNLQALEQELKSLKRFETIKLEKFLELSLAYEPNQEIQESLLTLIERIENLEIQLDSVDKTIRERMARLDHLFDNSLHIEKQANPLQNSYALKEYFEAQKIEEVKNFLSNNLNKIVKDIVGEYSRLLDFQEKVKPRIKQISKFFDAVDIGVIEKLTLRYQPSNNKVLEIFRAILEENNNNAYGFGLNLFNQTNNAKEMTKLLKELVDVIEKEGIETIPFKESFVLEFRVVENGNDSRFVTSLDQIGSNGTDVLVKTMIYIAMLAILKQKATKKELALHVILDEIGILSQRYLKELITFANTNGIYFVNGAPDEKLIGTYKRVYLISNKQNRSYAQELILQ